MLEFIKGNRGLAPLNAYLVYMQRPQCIYPLDMNTIQRLGRRLKPGAQALVTLLPKGPVKFFYDSSQTEPDPGLAQDGAQEGDFLAFLSQGIPVCEDIHEWFCTAVNYLRCLGIHVQEHQSAFQPDPSKPRYARAGQGPLAMATVWQDEAASRFILHRPGSFSREGFNSTILGDFLHEVGHHLMGHLETVRIKKKPARGMTEPAGQKVIVEGRSGINDRQREWEAELFAALCLSRLGVKVDSSPYLSMYREPGGFFPAVNLPLLFKQVNGFMSRSLGK